MLDDAAVAVDCDRANSATGAALPLRVRSVVADAAETVLRETAHTYGPAPLAFDERHASRVADLEIVAARRAGSYVINAELWPYLGASRW